MFSYRHGFHAGNHADVLKHVVLVQLLKALAAKEKPFMAIDTHAGAGAYSLDPGTYAAKNAEYATGIGRLWAAGTDSREEQASQKSSARAAKKEKLPEAISDYLEQIKSFNPEPTLLRYPGSPQLILQMTRPHDPLRFFELHPTESGVLRDYFRADQRRAAVRFEDGFANLKALLPPPSRRALVLIDPSYEDKDDYKRVTSTMREAFERFPTGVYAIWYPQVRRRESAQLPELLQRMAGGDWLHVSLTVATPPANGYGLYGSGMFVFNPPWQLAAAMRVAMPVLKARLGQDGKAAFTVIGKQR